MRIRMTRPLGFHANSAEMKPMLLGLPRGCKRNAEWRRIFYRNVAVTVSAVAKKNPSATSFNFSRSHGNIKQAVRVATRYAPPLSSLRGRRSAWRAAEQTQRSSSFPRGHAQYVLTVTAAPASRDKAAVSKAAWWPWPLTFWPWKWCPSHVWRGLPLCEF